MTIPVVDRVRNFFTLGTWIALLVLLLVLLGLGWWASHSRSASRQKAATATATAVQSQGQVGAARDAVGVITGNQASQGAIDAQTEKNNANINQQPGAAVPFNPAVGNAGRSSICVRKSAARLPECQRMQHPGSPGVAGRRSGGASAEF